MGTYARLEILFCGGPATWRECVRVPLLARSRRCCSMSLLDHRSIMQDATEGPLQIDGATLEGARLRPRRL